MIFVTVGTQLPFDRLVRTVDDWAGKTGADVFAQIGLGTYVPRHIRWTRTLRADECTAQTRAAQSIIAHAGMGSILTALQLGKPIVVMPRRSDLGEHRNDHQLTTARHFKARGHIRVALDKDELLSELNGIATLESVERISSSAPPALIGALRSFVRTVNKSASAAQAAGFQSIPGASIARV